MLVRILEKSENRRCEIVFVPLDSTVELLLMSYRRKCLLGSESFAKIDLQTSRR